MLRLSTVTLVTLLPALCLVGGAGCYDWGRTWPADGGGDGPADSEPTVDQPRYDAPVNDVVLDTNSADAFVPPGTWEKISAGSFTMGSPANEPCRDDNEDSHFVTLTKNFEISNTEVTQAMFHALMGFTTSSDFKGCAKCPMERVTWHQAAAYCNALSKGTGDKPCYECTGTSPDFDCKDAPDYADKSIYTCLGYRLPTEAEWEYAYRAGKQTAYYSSKAGPSSTQCDKCESSFPAPEAIGWYCMNSTSQTHPVGSGGKQANYWKLHDMGGNVWEWCHDWYQDHLGTANVTDPIGNNEITQRVIRGGGWQSPPDRLRAAERDHRKLKTEADDDTGFRCVRTLPP